MGEIIDIKKHPLGKGHPAQKDARLQTIASRLESDIEELHLSIREIKQKIDVTKEELRALDKLRAAAGKSQAGRVAEVLAALGFDPVESGDASNKRQATTMGQSKRTQLRLDEQTLERMYRALGDKMKEQTRVHRKLNAE